MQSIPCPDCNPKGESPDPLTATSWTYTTVPESELSDSFRADGHDFNGYILEMILDIMSRAGFDRQERESMLAAFLIDLEGKAHYGNIGTQDYIEDLEREAEERSIRLVLAERVVEEVRGLRNRGYDGPFMGFEIEHLLMRLREWEEATK
jgi:hypothetical protein